MQVRDDSLRTVWRDIEQTRTDFGKVLTRDSDAGEGLYALERMIEALGKQIETLRKEIETLKKQVEEPPKEKAIEEEKSKDFLHRVGWVFTFSFIATFVPLVSGLGSFPDLSTVKAATWSAAVAAMAAVLKIVQASFDRGQAPFLDKGIFGKAPDQVPGSQAS
jgi:hypothetical protein